MANTKEKYADFSTLNRKYLVRELKEGFETIERNGLKLHTAKKTGFEDTANFSNRCEVVVAPEGGKYKRGENVFVHHGIATDRFRNDWFGEVLYATREENIWFKGEKPEDLVDDELIIFKYLKKDIEEHNGIVTQVSSVDELRGEVVSGALPKGVEITYRINKEMEFFFNEEQYLITEKKFITSVNGKPFGEWYEYDDFEDEYFDEGLITLKGQLGAQRKYKIEPKHTQKIIKLNNELLPLHGKVVLGSETWQDNYIHSHPDFYAMHYSDHKRTRGILLEL
jgi:hypothetical protein